MSGYRVSKLKDGYMFHNRKNRVVLRKPIVYSRHDEKILDESDIMYFYYTLELYYNEFVGTIEENGELKNVYEWKLKQSKGVFDFPGIMQLKSMIEEIRSVDMIRDAQRNYYEYIDIGYTYSIESGGLVFDDKYVITRTLIEGCNSYSIYIGTSTEINPSVTTYGVCLDGLSGKDIKQFNTFIDKFIKYGIELCNEAIDKYDEEADEELF